MFSPSCPVQYSTRMISDKPSIKPGEQTRSIGFVWDGSFMIWVFVSAHPKLT